MLWLNAAGKRFMNEASVQQNMPVILRQPKGIIAAITDANWAESVKNSATDHGSPNFGRPDYFYELQDDMAAVELDGPAAHLDAVAHAARHAGHVLGVLAGAHGPLHELALEGPHHIGVAAVVAGGQDHGVARVVLDVGAVGALGDGAGHAAGLVLGQHHAALLEVVGGAELLALEDRELHHLVEAREGTGDRDHVGIDVVADVAHEHRGARPAAVAAAAHRVLHVAVEGDAGDLADALAGIEWAHLGVVGGGHELDALVGPLHEAHEVVHRLAGVGHVLAHELLTHAAARADAELLDDFAHIVGAKALVDEPLGVAVADVLALDLAHVLGHLFDDVDLGAALGRGAGALDARMAGTDHEDLGVDGLGDLVVGNDGLRAQPVGGAHVAPPVTTGASGAAAASSAWAATGAATAAMAVATAAPVTNVRRSNKRELASMGTSL